MARKDHDNLKSIAKRIDAKFRSLLAETVGTTSEHALAAPRLLSESQRFDVWGHNLGVFQGGHASLDYRFRDAPRVFDFAQRLLSNLDDTLNVGRSSSLI